MAQILFITSGIDSILNANFELARRLQADGHSVHYASPDDARERVEAQQIAYSPLQAITYATEVPRETIAGLGGWLAAWRKRQQRRDAAATQMLDPHFEEFLAGQAPDLILIDTELHAFIFRSIALGYRVALLSTFLSLWKRPGLPPLHLPIIPGLSREGSPAGIELAWLRYRSIKLRQRGRQWLRTAGLDDLSILQRLAQAQGLNFGAIADSTQWLIPFIYRRLPVLNLNALELDFPHEPAPTSHHVGPMIARQRRDTADPQGAALLDWLMQRPKRPLIYCAYGAHYKRADTEFWQRLNAVAQAHPEWDFVFGLGKRLPVSALGPLAENVRAYSWVPQLRVLEQADCAIIHGGISTINECILYGVPMLVYPFPVTDQRGNAARVVYHGLGLLGDRAQDSPENIGAAISQLLPAEGPFRVATQAMQAHFERYEQGNALRRVIQRLLD